MKLRNPTSPQGIPPAKEANPQSTKNAKISLYHKTTLVLLLFLSATIAGYGQQDTSRQKIKEPRITSLGGVFISIGGGLSVPLGEFSNNSDVAFGLLGRVEVSTFSIFPLVIGGEVTYFSYDGTDEFKTKNLLSTFKTQVISFGLTAEYALPKLFKSTYMIPFITADVKYTPVKRDIIPSESQLENLPVKENLISVGAGAGFTLFIFDFHAKYTYRKNLTEFGVFMKVKFPVIRF